MRLVTERPDRDLYEIGDPAYDASHVVEGADPGPWGEAADRRPPCSADAGPTGVCPKGTLPSGFEAWNVRLPDAVVAAPVFCVGAVYVDCSDGRISLSAGAVLWRHALEGREGPAPSMPTGSSTWARHAGKVLAMDAETGRKPVRAWRRMRV
ncbi:hypothetical protein ABWK57_34200 [Streptomyces sp. NPDC094045]|uniref:hypothetical protein n=1 Tax=Streptomyces sp. NPDC094045 TaxID=3161019 RepID=UPI0033985159